MLFFRCKCGLKLEDHEDSIGAAAFAADDPAEKWSYKTCTEEFPTNAYGHINFTKIEADFLPKFLRFSYKDDMKHLKELIQDKWKFPKTYLIMVVIGGR